MTRAVVGHHLHRFSDVKGSKRPSSGLMKAEIAMNDVQLERYKIEVAPEMLGGLQRRLKNTRWSYPIEGTNWDAGTDLRMSFNAAIPSETNPVSCVSLDACVTAKEAFQRRSRKRRWLNSSGWSLSA